MKTAFVVIENAENGDKYQLVKVPDRSENRKPETE